MKQKFLSIAIIYSATVILLNSITTWDSVLGLLSIIPFLGTVLIIVSINCKNPKFQTRFCTAGICSNLGSSIVFLIYTSINGAISNRHYISEITNPYNQYFVNMNYDAITEGYNRYIILFGSLIIIAWNLFLIYHFMKINLVGIITGILFIIANFVPCTINTNIGKTAYLLFGVEIILYVLLKKENSYDNINQS